MKLSWNWLQDYITVKAAPEEAALRLTMAGLEVEEVKKIGSDYQLTTEVTSNRPDWLSHIGVARELAALFGGKLKMPSCKLPKSESTERVIQIRTPDSKWCHFYSGVILEGVDQRQTPSWMRERLEVCGIRSINLIVDITNYVLLETGQPLHAFDLNQLQGNTITARHAKAKEKFQALNDIQYELISDDLVIADERGPVALGGVMGGKQSEVTSSTKNILLESAAFSAAAIRRTSRRLKLISDSSYRFERGVDPALVAFARHRAAHLIEELAGVGKIGRTLSSGKLVVKTKRIILAVEEIPRILGLRIPAAKIKKILISLGIRTSLSGKKLICQIPSSRSDITIPEDLIEEAARIHGYDRIPERLPTLKSTQPQIDPLLSLADEVRNICISFGLQEMVSFSLIAPQSAESLSIEKKQWVTVDNPRNQNLTLMRPSLAVSCLEAVQKNLNVGSKSVRLFEVANRYLSAEEALPLEERMLGIILCGHKAGNWLDPERPYELFDLKGIIASLCQLVQRRNCRFDISKNSMFVRGQGFDLMHDQKRLGNLGVISQSIKKNFDIDRPVFFAELSLSQLAQIQPQLIKYEDILKFPPIERDLSLVVDLNVRAQDLSNEIMKLGKGLIRSVEIFDLYQGKKMPVGKKSVAFRLLYQSPERTLQAQEVNELHFAIVDALQEKFKASLPTKA
ncbi:MAG: phenylalanine--tRNA ligase subunit beta [Candidatus Omnitrophica bacterium CG11_big_fil_rev_8_21_14_0_20_45_26]|uniref:Phenylalanine--tRNA ligase beta subunit n=1 Tax=Candidatus Abzuiibacterium crystallinum TaxID=1974748 RepID=A0A2H0LU70_9BACT|nr:MAG: phenylalanine--tRNA ligase subunit beta [Candidatus Omnitrophica bacterium CG11_big_fil_rev_8_21_14_0_20_45_26]PIW64963.1 MAG: phenylalanine--tRNA ligase subunit beta [Candidatus Omnitrophica bacterium CG12_big_fil_rev_8_21_14_0_65_45_16]